MGGLSVLVVDDDRLSLATTTAQLRDHGFDARSARSAYAALERLGEDPVQVVLTDLRMPGMDGLELLQRIREDHPGVEVILMTAYASVETAVSAMRDGAADYLTKPFRFEELQVRLDRLGEVRQCRLQLRELKARVETRGEDYGIVGQAPEVRRALELIHLFSDHDAPVLVTGETGTGKELVARALHRAGSRSSRAFVALPCGAIPHELAESELFGHERGAFTGASGRRAGAFERAHRGTLLLDDIDDLPLPLGAKLLRALQEGVFTRVGGAADIKVDVRVVATTKVDLGEAARAGAFRPDLYYRLRGLEIQLPSLRQRGADILLLAERFLARAGREKGRSLSLSTEAAEALMDYPWPGNIRELKHMMGSASVLCPGERVRLEHLPRLPRAGGVRGGRNLYTLNLHGTDAVDMPELIRAIEQDLVEWALLQSGGKQTRASRMLGIPRTTLQHKIHR